MGATGQPKGLTPEDIAAIEGLDSSTDGESDAERRRRIRKILIDIGALKPTESDVIDQFGDVLDSELPGDNAEELFRRYMSEGTLDTYKSASERDLAEGDYEARKGDALSLLASLIARGGGSRTVQQPSTSGLFKSFQDAALGPAPDLLFRDIQRGVP